MKNYKRVELHLPMNPIFLGDSITEGFHASTPDHAFPALINTEYGINSVNEGIGGATWQNGSDNDDASLVTRSKKIDFSQTDTVVLFAGTNDYGQSLPVGHYDDKTDHTMMGAINLTLENIYKSNPNINILMITPSWRARIHDKIHFEDVESNTNKRGRYFKEYVHSIVKMSRKYDLPVLNLYKKFGVNKLNYKQWLYDGLHPNDQGYQKLANKIAKFMMING